MPENRSNRLLAFALAGLLGVSQAANVAVFPTNRVAASADSVETLVHGHLLQSGHGVQLGSSWEEHNDFVHAATHDLNGHSIMKFHQYYKGVRVHNAALVAHVDSATRAVRSLVGHAAAATRHIDNMESVMPKHHAYHTFRTAKPSLNLLTEPELRVLDTDEHSRLVYVALAEYQEEGEWMFGRMFIDAHSGEVVDFETRKYGALRREVYKYPDVCAVNIGAQLPGSKILYEGETTTNYKAQDAYDNIGSVYWFYKNLFDLDSYDGKGSKYVSTIEGLIPVGVRKCAGDNAFWYGDPFNQMVYAIDGNIFTDIQKSVDVVGHEVTHAVTDKSSSLVYKDESGALNEAVSDCMGVGVAIWAANGGSSTSAPSNWSTTEKSWWIGASVINPSSGLEAIRFMNNPTRDGFSPDNYKDIRTGTADNGYVHSNSGIFNLFFYLLSEGGKHPRIDTGVTVSGLGLEKALRIVHYANTKLFTEYTNYEQARYHCATAAETLFGKGSAEYNAVHAAMDAVLVPGSKPPATEEVKKPVALPLRGTGRVF